MSSNKTNNVVMIGSIERISLPDLGVKDMEVKIDTGARRSALHAENIRIEEEDGKEWVYFDVMVGSKDQLSPIPAKAELVEMKTFVSSNGQSTLRPVIETRFQIGEHIWSSQASLIDRSAMDYRMLLGRLSIKDKFTVDVSHKFLLS